jgi:hypothetical protein
MTDRTDKFCLVDNFGLSINLEGEVKFQERLERDLQAKVKISYHVSFFNDNIRIDAKKPIAGTDENANCALFLSEQEFIDAVHLETEYEKIRNQMNGLLNKCLTTT